ncbi:baseplate hub [Haloarcula virus HCTV-16]|nr:baseplate hub [Haloarcula virus HCTV-16]
MPELQIRVERPNGTQDVFDGTRSAEKYELDKIDTASAYCLRSDINQLSLNEDEDEVYITEGGSDLFGGILRDVKRGGSEVELIVESFERLALDSQPTSGDDNYDAVSDRTIVRDAVDDMANLSRGTIQVVKSNVTLLFSHVSQAKKVRTVTDVSGAEVRYNADKTVDYLPSLGSNKTNITLSPSSQNVVGGFKPKRVGGSERVTHLRMLGEGEGEAQIQAEIVADSYSPGDRQRWDTYINKDISDEDTLREQGQTLLEELQNPYIEIKATVKSVDVELGDRFRVLYPEEEIDTDLRVVEQTRRVTPDGVLHDVVLSNRANSRETEAEKEVRDVDRYNTSFEGSPVTYSTNGGRQPVSPDHDYEFSVYYPEEVTHEHRMKLQVKGLAYRAFSRGAAEGGGEHSHEVEIDVPSHTHDLNVSDHTHDIPIQVTTPSDAPDANNAAPLDIGTSRGGTGTFTRQLDYPAVNGDGTTGLVFLNVSYSDTNVNDSFGVLQTTIENQDTGTTIYEDTVSIGFDPGENLQLVLTETGADLNGDTLQFSFDVQSSGADGSFRFSYGAVLIGDHQHQLDAITTSDADGGFIETTEGGGGVLESRTTTTESGDHDHDPLPGIIERFTLEDENGDEFVDRLYPENVDVEINGQQLGLSMGDGENEFEETVDISGRLQEGGFNTIRLTSDSIGHLQAHLDLDVYRQIRGSG